MTDTDGGDGHPRGLTHLDGDGAAHMVDVGHKAVTARQATAEGEVRVSAALERAIAERAVAKGDLFAVARVAGIQAAKETARLVPLCHVVPLDQVQVDLRLRPGRVQIRATACATARTGVEMEALAAVMGAALAIFDMGKAVDPAASIEAVRVTRKSGGRSGERRSPSDWEDEP